MSQEKESLKSDEITALAGLVAALPEVYQPIFGHAEFSHRVKRESTDRLEHIRLVYGALQSRLGRPLRVLDLGCAQGFFSLSLAELGATVHGVDFQDVNVAVCNAVAAENPQLKASFQVARAEEILMRLKPDEYDLLLGLSIFHHTVHKFGFGAVQKILTDAAEKVAAALFELALSNEPLYWAGSQPLNPRRLLAGFPFVHEFAHVATHLSEVKRPLYFASARYWFLDGHLGAFDTWRARSHIFANGPSVGTRRYFFGNGLVVKQFHLDHAKSRDDNIREYANEIAILKNPPGAFKVPLLLFNGQYENEAWLAREMVPGELLVDRMRAGRHIDVHRILCDILDHLVILETEGFYHNDLRVWNVLIDANDRATLIDYGAIVQNQNDCVWPLNVFLAFLIFVHELIDGKIENPDPFRSPALNPETLPEPYRRTLWGMLELPPHQWRFALIRDALTQPHGMVPPAGSHAGIAAAFEAMETACRAYQGMVAYWRHRAEQSEAFVQKLQDSINKAEEQKEPASPAAGRERS